MEWSLNIFRTPCWPVHCNQMHLLLVSGRAAEWSLENVNTNPDSICVIFLLSTFALTSLLVPPVVLFNCAVYTYMNGT